MMLALLVVLTVSVLAVPLLPALREWMRPSDIVPLKIDEADALDPPYLAQRFVALLAEAVRTGASHLGGSSISHLLLCQQSTVLPLRSAEIQAGRSDRLWHIEGEAQLTERTHFYAEVSASGALRTAPHGVYRALWSGATLTLASVGTVLRWAHGRDVHVGAGCHLAGRVTAQHVLTLAPGCDFMLLHAPRIGFVEQEEQEEQEECPQAHPQVHTAVAAVPCRPVAEWPPGAVWNSTVRRAFARSALQLEAQHSWRGDVVCLADMVLGPHCRADGSLKARRSLRLGAGCHVSGSVVAEGAIYLEPGCTVLGSVLSETAIFVASGCTIGAPGRLATLTAPQIQIASRVTVHGTVWAEEKGHASVEGVLA